MDQIIKIKDRKVYESLVQFLKALGLDVNGNNIVSIKRPKGDDYPLEGTVLKYEHPFAPVEDPDDWSANR
jgi:hypothetical protein